VEELRNCGLNSGSIKDIFFLCGIHTCSGIHQPIHWILGAVALVVKQPECEVWPLTSVWCCTKFMSNSSLCTAYSTFS